MHNPYSVQIELSHGCTRFCDHCGIQSIWNPKEKKEFASIDMIKKFLQTWMVGLKNAE